MKKTGIALWVLLLVVPSLGLTGCGGGGGGGTGGTTPPPSDGNPPAIGTADFNATGQWVLLRYKWGAMPQELDPAASVALVTIGQTAEDQVTLSIEGESDYAGTVDGADYQLNRIVNGEGTTTSEMLTVTLSSSNEGQGIANLHQDGPQGSVDASGQVLLLRVVTPTRDLSGTWSYSRGAGTSEPPGFEPSPDTGTLDLEQSGGQVSITPSGDSTPFQGYVTGNRYLLVRQDPGGSPSSEVLTLTASGASKASGEYDFTETGPGQVVLGSAPLDLTR